MCFQQRGQSQEQIAQYRNHLLKPLPRFLSRHNLKQIHECTQLKWWNWKVRKKSSVTSSKKSSYPSEVEGDKGWEERERAFLRSEIAWNKRRPESTRPPPSSLSVSTAWDGQNREEERMRSGRYGRIDCNSSLSSILCSLRRRQKQATAAAVYSDTRRPQIARYWHSQPEMHLTTVGASRKCGCTLGTKIKLLKN